MQTEDENKWCVLTNRNSQLILFATWLKLFSGDHVVVVK
jgi:hypothetical protein